MSKNDPSPDASNSELCTGHCDWFFWDHFNQFGFMTMHLINPGQTESTKVSVCLRLLIFKSKPKMEGSLFLLKWKCRVSIRYFILLTLKHKCFIKTEKLGLFPDSGLFQCTFWQNVTKESRVSCCFSFMFVISALWLTYSTNSTWLGLAVSPTTNLWLCSVRADTVAQTLKDSKSTGQKHTEEIPAH